MAATTVNLRCAERGDVVDRKQEFLEMVLDDDNDCNAKFLGPGANLSQAFDGRRCEESCIGWRSEYALQTPDVSWVSFCFSFSAETCHSMVPPPTKRFGLEDTLRPSLHLLIPRATHLE